MIYVCVYLKIISFVFIRMPFHGIDNTKTLPKAVEKPLGQSQVVAQIQSRAATRSKLNKTPYITRRTKNNQTNSYSYVDRRTDGQRDNT